MRQSAEEQAYADARRVLNSLLIGIDPETHTSLSHECVVMQPEVKTALALGIEALRETGWVRRWREKRAQSSAVPTSKGAVRSSPQPSLDARQRPEQAGRPWSKQEDVRLTSAFYQNRPLRTIAAAHGRTTGGIASRLVRLGLVESRQEARRVR